MVVKMRRCHFKKLLMTSELFQGHQKQQTESFLKTLVHLFLRFSRKSFVSILLGCFQTFWTHCITTTIMKNISGRCFLSIN
ncbi:unnamed protein product [Tenebrio molitor]|nr:unnamed protein product [Tenebrio molitor]